MRRIVAGVEDEEGPGLGSWLLGEEGPDLLNGNGVGILGRWDAPDIARRSPAVPGEVELCQPLIRPPGNDRLPSRVPRGMIVKAPPRTRVGIAARPDAQVDRIDRLAVAGGVLLASAVMVVRVLSL